MKRVRLSLVLPLGFLFLLTAGALLADWIAPYSAVHEDRTKSFHPPTQLHFVTAEGHFSLRPSVFSTRATYDENLKRVYKEGGELFPVRFGSDRLFKVDAPANLFLLGTDSRGRDIFSRLLYGGRISLSIGLIGVLAASAMGLLIGCLSGYLGGRIDQLLMRLAELFIMIPGFYLLLALRSALPASLGSKEIYFMIVLTLGFIGWGGIARVIRGMVFSLRESEFILAAKVLGRRTPEILIRHILPHTLSYLAIVISISIPSYILAESVLSVLGLGIQEPDVSWGNMLSEAMSVAHIQLHPWVLFPGMLIFLCALCFNLLGDSLREGQEK